MALGDAAFSQADIMRRLAGLEAELRAIKSSRRLENSTVGEGGVRVKGSGGITLQAGGGMAVQDGGDISLEGGNVKITDGALTVYNAEGRRIVELGRCSDGRYGIQVFDENTTPTARLGELAAGGQGIEVVDDTGKLVKISTLAFGTKGDTVAALQGTSSTSYVGLGGPVVSGVTIGDTGRCVVLLSAWLLNGTTSGVMGFSISGDTSRAAADDTAIGGGVGTLGGNFGLGRAVLVEGLNPGTHTFTAMYRSSAASSSQFFNRQLIVMPF
jgi:hypothetical protein